MSIQRAFASDYDVFESVLVWYSGLGNSGLDLLGFSSGLDLLNLRSGLDLGRSRNNLSRLGIGGRGYRFGWHNKNEFKVN